MQTSFLANMDFILAGMFQDQNTASKNLNKSQEVFAEKLYSDIRKVYDEYMPNIHILDADNVASLIIKGIIEDISVVLTISDKSYEPEVIRAIIKAAPSIRKDIREGIAELHNKFSTRTIGNPIRLLNAKLSLYVRQVNRDSSGLLSRDQYLGIGKYFNSLINSTFPKNVALLGVSAESLGIVSKPNRFIFFQKSFLSGKDTINQNITSILKASLAKIKAVDTYSNITTAKSIIGNFVDFGHVGTRVTGSQVISINTPALTKIVYNVTNLSLQVLKVSSRSPEQAKAIFINKTGHISQSIEVTKKFNTRTGMLINIGLTQTTDMGSEFNRTVLGGKEKRLSDSTTKDKFSSSILMREALKSRMEGTFLGPNISKLATSTSSYSLLQYLEIAIANTLQGKKTPAYTAKVSKTKSNTITTKVLSDITKGITAGISGTVKTYPNVPIPKAPPIRNLQGQFYSLSSLQLLLDTHLQDVISANMGSGSESRILNYRTGRFASSAKVERLSQSREGMVTAFYSYMKNPYATFSEGGAQSTPKTRDPKLLISTSIREIAATKVGSRLRAVLV